MFARGDAWSNQLVTEASLLFWWCCFSLNWLFSTTSGVEVSTERGN
jgi:hypothetical protein